MTGRAILAVNVSRHKTPEESLKTHNSIKKKSIYIGKYFTEWSPYINFTFFEYKFITK